MGILADHQIREEISIHPMAEKQVSKGVISYGVGSYGYDCRVGRDYKVFTDVYSTLVDPKNFNPKSFIDFLDQDFCIIPPNSFALAKSLEVFEIPRGIIAIAIGKSTYSRCGIVVGVTPIESSWRGAITIEISNTTPLPCKIYSEEGIMQLLFLRGEKPCDVSYADKNGIYQDQTEITLPRVRS